MKKFLFHQKDKKMVERKLEESIRQKDMLCEEREVLRLESETGTGDG